MKWNLITMLIFCLGGVWHAILQLSSREHYWHIHLIYTWEFSVSLPKQKGQRFIIRNKYQMTLNYGNNLLMKVFSYEYDSVYLFKCCWCAMNMIVYFSRRIQPQASTSSRHIKTVCPICPSFPHSNKMKHHRHPSGKPRPPISIWAIHTHTHAEANSSISEWHKSLFRWHV